MWRRGSGPGVIVIHELPGMSRLNRAHPQKHGLIVLDFTKTPTPSSRPSSPITARRSSPLHKCFENFIDDTYAAVRGEAREGTPDIRRRRAIRAHHRRRPRLSQDRPVGDGDGPGAVRGERACLTLGLPWRGSDSLRRGWRSVEPAAPVAFKAVKRTTVE